MKKWDWNIAHWNGKQKLMAFFVLWVVIALLCWFFIPGWRDLPGGGRRDDARPPRRSR